MFTCVHKKGDRLAPILLKLAERGCDLSSKILYINLFGGGVEGGAPIELKAL